MKKSIILFLAAIGLHIAAEANVADEVREHFEKLRSDSEYHQILWSEIQRAAFTVSGTNAGEFQNCSMSDFVVGFANAWSGKYCSYAVGDKRYVLDLASSDCGLMEYLPKGIHVTKDFNTRLVKFSSSALRSLAKRTDLFPFTCGATSPGNIPGYCAFHPNAPICRQNNYCQMNPGNIACRNGGSSYCNRNPNSAGCK